MVWKFGVIAMFVAVAFAGCSEDSGAPTDEGPEIEVSDTTGGIRGVVIDESVVAIEGATVALLGTDESVVTGADGLFVFSDLEPGTYFLDVTRLLYEGVQTSVEVEAGVAEPPMLKVQITRIAGINPYVEGVQFDGYYECAYAVFFQTDSCDWVVRTVYDAGVTVGPRTLQNNVNTVYHTFADTTQTIIQEGFWDAAATPNMWFMVDSTPIDNGCDCSDHTYVEAISGPPTYARKDVPDEPTVANWPEDGADVAIRGFVPFAPVAEPAYAVDVKFQIFTHFFHSFQPADGWNIEDRDQYPVPE